MLNLLRRDQRRALQSERGFTLVEILVAMALGIVVVSAVITTLDATMAQATRTFTMIDATQRTRPALARIENELVSACLTSGVTPIQAGSTANSVIFMSAYGNAAQPTPIEHVITFSATSGTLTDSLYAVSGGSAPNWTFASSPYTTTRLLAGVAQSGTSPVFQYFAYQQAPKAGGGYYTDGAGNPFVMLLDGTSSVPGTNPAVIPTPSPLPDSGPSGLSAVNAQAAAEVLISVRVGASGGPYENTTISGGPLNVTDSVVLRLTPPPNNAESGGTFGPCQ